MDDLFFTCKLKMHKYWLRSYWNISGLGSVADLFFLIKVIIMLK